MTFAIKNMNAQQLREELIQLTQENIMKVSAFQQLPIDKLTERRTPESWSVLECIEHLNRYGKFYIPEISNRITTSTYTESKTFKSGWLGNYFAKSMLPKEKQNKMKTFTSMNPLNCSLDKNVLTLFLNQQKQILKLLEASAQTDLSKVKTSVSISKWIKLRLGDTFRIVIYHNLRHILQAENVLHHKTIE